MSGGAFLESWEEYFKEKAPKGKPGEPEVEDSELLKIAEITEVIEAHEREIFNYENVVGVGAGFKTVGGEPTRELGLVVFVEKKLEEDVKLLSKRDTVPPEIEGKKTDVVEVGRIEALTYKGCYRPAFPGCSIGHYRITAGTFGCMVQDKRTHAFKILSNNHVLANTNAARIGDPILQPGRYDGGIYPRDMIAKLEKFVPLSASTYNLVDAAVAGPINLRYVIASIARLGIPTGTAQARLGWTVYKAGRTTQLTSGRVTATNASVKVGYGGGITLLFRNQILTTRMGAGGDSGSLLVDPYKRAVGLLFAGSSTITVHNHITNVLMALGVEMVTAL
ncbi:MAG: hypothetical protein GH149_06350 [Methanosarcinales archaeon]|nr:hypothetical protein [Methanosarcinales archaeon]